MWNLILHIYLYFIKNFIKKYYLTIKFILIYLLVKNYNINPIYKNT